MDSNVRIKQDLYNKMKEISVSTGRNITKEFEYAIQCYIKDYRQEQVKRESNIESLLNERFAKLDKHLSSMMARTGMDVSMGLMGTINILKLVLDQTTSVGEMTQVEIEEKLRVLGAAYFAKTIKKDKEEPKIR